MLRARPGLPVSEPLCPGVVDLLRQVQKAPERKQLEREPGTQPPAPQALSCPGCSCIRALISSCPRLGAEHLWAFAMRRLGILQQSPGRGGFPCRPLPLPQGLSQDRRKYVKSQQQLWYLVWQRQLHAPNSLACGTDRSSLG